MRSLDDVRCVLQAVHGRRRLRVGHKRNAAERLRQVDVGSDAKLTEVLLEVFLGDLLRQTADEELARKLLVALRVRMQKSA